MCLQFAILQRHLGRRTRHGLVYFDGKSERNFTIMHFGYHRLGDMTARMRKVMARPWVGVGVCHLLLLFLLSFE